MKRELICLCFDSTAPAGSYGDQCLDYLLRAPDGSALQPDVLYFNFGLHNTGNSTIPGQAGPASEYAPHLDNIAKKLRQVPFLSS